MFMTHKEDYTSVQQKFNKCEFPGIAEYKLYISTYCHKKPINNFPCQCKSQQLSSVYSGHNAQSVTKKAVDLGHFSPVQPMILY